jgi:hypothetical protein
LSNNHLPMINSQQASDQAGAFPEWRPIQRGPFR